MATRNLLAALIKSREAYEQVQHGLDSINLAETERRVLAGVQAYYTRDAAAKHCDAELLANEVCRGLPNPKHQRLFRELVSSLAAADVSPANVVSDYVETQREAAGSKLATALAAGKSADEVRPLVEEYQQWATADGLDAGDKSEVVVALPARDLVARRTRRGGLVKIYPSSLNERLDGGLLPGQTFILFARPEVGKTAFAVNALAGFARQQLRALYVGNEDPLDEIVMRTIGRMSGLVKSEIIDDPDKAYDLAMSVGYEHLVFASLTPGTPGEVDALVREYKPQVVVIDQLRNMNVGEDNFVRALEKAAQGMRRTAKRSGLVGIGLTQAGDSASGKSVLDMGDVDNSNTGIPGACDVLAGFGMSAEDEARGLRVFSLCKNKAGGNHDFWPVRIDTKRSRLYNA